MEALPSRIISSSKQSKGCRSLIWATRHVGHVLPNWWHVCVCVCVADLAWQSNMMLQHDAWSVWDVWMSVCTFSTTLQYDAEIVSYHDGCAGIVSSPVAYWEELAVKPCLKLSFRISEGSSSFFHVSAKGVAVLKCKLRVHAINILVYCISSFECACTGVLACCQTCRTCSCPSFFNCFEQVNWQDKPWHGTEFGKCVQVHFKSLWQGSWPLFKLCLLFVLFWKHTCRIFLVVPAGFSFQGQVASTQSLIIRIPSIASFHETVVSFLNWCREGFLCLRIFSFFFPSWGCFPASMQLSHITGSVALCRQCLDCL